MASENILTHEQYIPLTNAGNLPFLMKRRAIFHQDCNKNSLCESSQCATQE